MPNEIKRVPPHSKEAEQAVLASLLIDERAADKVMHTLTPSDFYHPQHQYIFSVLIKLHDEMKPKDIVTLASYLSDNNTLARAGGVEYISSLVEIIPNSANVGYYAGIIKEKSTLRQLIHLSADMTEMCYEQVDDIRDVVETAEKRIFELAEDKLKADVLAIGEHMHRTFEVLEKLYHRKEETTGVPSGFRDLDELTNGFQRSDLIIVAGRPGMGKTAFTLNLAMNATYRPKEQESFTVAFFSLEMSSQQLVQRLLSAQAGVDSNKLRTGKFSMEEWQNLTAAAGELSELKLYLDDTPAINSLELRAKCRRLKREHGLDMVVVDYLQLMGSAKGTESREQQIAEISRSLKALAKELDIPIIALSQLNRGVENRPDKRPNISDLRESGAIEQDADLIVFLYRDEMYHKDTAEPGVTEVIVAKHRNGSTGTVKLTFIKEYMLFKDLYKHGV
ncbi:replicative DNA helicase [Limisalsivibrio acetivorans]|uniref:replicative DNA helicase n=1 Tax=Limisalsivibrio acetivorans TaxID=1304888 RepID=UPI0003B589D3|nr:replicative DNA helicase [Limisalsivibrio acetivorans]